MGVHRLICGDSTNPEVLKALMCGAQARLILTDEPYNVPIAGHVTRRERREFLMASGEMTDAQFEAFNAGWMGAILPNLYDGGLLGTFIDWRGYSAVKQIRHQADNEGLRDRLVETDGQGKVGVGQWLELYWNKLMSRNISQGHHNSIIECVLDDHVGQRN
jgi:hypothetical protein